jgi:hypothetical protein
MTKKMMSKVCIDCVNANEHLKFGPEFKVSVEFGTCDCCGKRHVLVPFGRFFDDEIELTPCTAQAIPTQEDGSPVIVQKYDDKELKENIEKLHVEREEHIKLIRELQDKVGALEIVTQKEVESPVEPLQPDVKDKKKDDKKNDKMFD